MSKTSQKHENYEILNLLGYGLAKFNKKFAEQFGFKTKDSFYQYFVDLGISETKSVVKNRMDLFDPFFNNGRKGWWQKGDVYLHRKIYIDSLFGNEDVKEFSNIVKLYLKTNFKTDLSFANPKPIVKTRFKKLQETGFEAESYFVNNFNQIHSFKGGSLLDARLFGDGYDFQIDLEQNSFLAEVKGIREKKGKFRLTQNEFLKAKEYKKDYFVVAVSNLNDIPNFILINDPLSNLKFNEIIVKSKENVEYHLVSDIC